MYLIFQLKKITRHKHEQAWWLRLFSLIVLLLLPHSSQAGDPFVEKQRVIQKEIFERFTALDHKFNPPKKTATELAALAEKPKPYAVKPS